MRKSVRVAAAIVTFGAAYAAAQSAPANPPKEVISNGGLIHTLEAAPVVGEPYSAVQVSQLVRTLADGTTIHQGPGPGHAVMRDAEGRVRVEKRLIKPSANDPGVTMVFVLDPVAHTMTTWSTGGKGERIALLIKLPKDEQPHPQSVPAAQPVRVASNRPLPIVTTEDMRAETLEGVSVDVVKTTTIVPAGRSGNDAPITKTHEVWTSPDLKLVMKEQSTDPRTGELTIWLTKFSRADPAPAFFQAPSGYKVQSLKETMQQIAERLANTPD